VCRTGLIAVTDRGVGPGGSCALHELDAVGCRRELDGYLMVDRCGGLDVEAKSHEAEVPTDPHRTRAELFPPLGVDGRLVGKLQGGATVGDDERDVEPRCATAHRGR
jgi:hypothetical protein